MKTTIKNIVFLLFVGLMIFARSINAQTVIYVQGNVSDLNGVAIANQNVYLSDDTSSLNLAIAITDVNGDYIGTLTTLNNQGIIFVGTEDCNNNLVLNTHPYTPNTQTIISNFIICAPNTTIPCTLTAASVSSTPNGLTVVVSGGSLPYTYLWSNGSNTTWQQFYPNWCVTIMDASGCDTTICDTSNVSSSCQAAFQSYNIGFNPAAVPVVMQFDDWSVGTNINNWIWDFGDGTTGTGQFPIHSYAIPGSYYACLTVEEIDPNGTIVCTDTYCDSVYADTFSFGPPPSCFADFYSTQVSASDSTFFFNTSGGTTNSTSYLWDFGDNTSSTDENPIHLYTVSGWYYVCLTIMDSTSNCYSTYCDYINIIVGSSGPGNCQAYFTGYPSWNGGVNTFDFYDYSAGNITNWIWNFGDGNTSTLQNPTHTYSPTSAGFYYVCLTIEETDPATGTLLCSDTYCDSIFINNPINCHAYFSGQDLGNNEVLITNYSGPQTGPTWGGFGEVDIDYGDGVIDYSIGTTISHTYSAPGSYYVCITTTTTDSSGFVYCTDTYCDSITVTSGGMPCQSDFCYQRDSIVITQNPNGNVFNDIYMFCDLSTPVGYIQSYSWNMGGQGTYLWGTSDTSSAPLFAYDTFGVYYPCLTITTITGCVSTSCDTISFQPMIGQNSINNTILSDLKLFPNPVNSILNIEMTLNTANDIEVNIINMVGQKVITKNSSAYSGNTNVRLNVSHLSDGVYSVEMVLGGSEKLYKRVVISR